MKRISAHFALALALLARIAIAAPPSDEDLESAIKGLGDEKPEVREESRRVILRWGDAEPAALLKRLPAGSDDPEVVAALASIRVALKRRVAVLERGDRVLAAAGKDEALQAATKELLKNLSSEAFLEPAEDAPERLPETDGVLTPYVLGRYADGKAGVRKVMEVLLTDPDLGIRRIASRILYYHGSPDDQAALVAAMADEDPYIRGCSALTLSHYGVKAATEDIRKLETDPDPRVRKHAGIALAELDAISTPEQLRERLKSPDAGVRLQAINDLVGQNDVASLESIAPLLDDPSTDVANGAARALQKLGKFEFDADAALRNAAKEWWKKRK